MLSLKEEARLKELVHNIYWKALVTKNGTVSLRHIVKHAFEIVGAIEEVATILRLSDWKGMRAKDR